MFPGRLVLTKNFRAYGRQTRFAFQAAIQRQAEHHRPDQAVRMCHRSHLSAYLLFKDAQGRG